MDTGVTREPPGHLQGGSKSSDAMPPIVAGGFGLADQAPEHAFWVLKKALLSTYSLLLSGLNPEVTGDGVNITST